MTILSRRGFGTGAVAFAGAVSLPGFSHAAACSMPDWAVKLRADLEQMAKDLTARLKPWSGPDLVVAPEDHGYTGGLATKAIQAAIDAAAKTWEDGGIWRRRPAARLYFWRQSFQLPAAFAFAGPPLAKVAQVQREPLADGAAYQGFDTR